MNDRRIEGIAEIGVGDRIRFGNTVWRLGPSSGAEGDEGRSTAGDAAGSGLAG